MSKFDGFSLGQVGIFPGSAAAVRSLYPPFPHLPPPPPPISHLDVDDGSPTAAAAAAAAAYPIGSIGYPYSMVSAESANNNVAPW